jgi:PTH1 family peptidyl-tRNA hydrolase
MIYAEDDCWVGKSREKISHTRHNIVFMVIDALVEKYYTYKSYCRIPQNNCVQLDSKIIHNNAVIFVKPLDWMNSSGNTISLIKRVCNYNPLDIMVIHDDMDFEFGDIKVKCSGNSGRHNGVQSIIDTIGKDFTRFRIGIGRPKIGQTASDYVLSDFSISERKCFCELFGLAIDVVDTFIKYDVQHTMNIYNKKREKI